MVTISSYYPSNVQLSGDKKGNYNDYIKIDSAKTLYKTYSIVFPGTNAFSSTSIGQFSGDAKWALWAMKDVPAFKQQDYVANTNQFLTAFSFQLFSIKYSETNKIQVIKSWNETVNKLLKSEHFGDVLNKEKTLGLTLKQI